MKKIISLILAMIAIALPSIAKESNVNTSSEGIVLEYFQQNETSGRHRAPMRINIIEAWYNADDLSINISCNGESTGEVL